MKRWLLMTTLATACVVTTGCFQDTFRNCSLFRGDPCGDPCGDTRTGGGLCDWNWFGTRDRVQPVYAGYGSCVACDSCVGCVGCAGCEGYTSYSPGMEVVEGGVYYEGIDGGLDGTAMDGEVLGGSLIPGGYEGEIINRGGTVVLPGPAQ